jgi:hypothetical protein
LEIKKDIENIMIEQEKLKIEEKENIEEINLIK